VTPPGFGSNLARRVWTALIALPAIVAVDFMGSPSVGVVMVAAAAGIGLFEFFALMSARQVRPMRGAGLVLAGALFLDVVYPGWCGAPLSPLGALLLLLVTLRRAPDLANTVPAAAATLLGATYLGVFGGTLAALRVLPPLGDGSWRIVLLLTIIISSDTAAFFVGHRLGRNRLAPHLSPGKTVEGAIGGLLGGVAGALAVRALGLPGLPFAHAVVLGGAVAAMGILGDLDESLFKRWAGVKDSGGLFPGHGGMLDRLDGLLFGAPVLYYYFLYVR
jgi:phosphatidate cytidylyltransferase